jgi:endonuclease/exonuclease/phosphatase family metal-dependent hydrolase
VKLRSTLVATVVLTTTAVALPASVASGAASAPPQPSNVKLLRAGADKNGIALTWGKEDATGFTVQQATNKSMSRSVHTYRIEGNVTQFTPYGLQTGGTYYFRVRADKGSAHSGYSRVLSATFKGAEAKFSMMTWNVLHMKFDGTKENGNTIAPWSKRLPVVISMIKNADPDIIDINEANDYVHPNDPSSKVRQIDTIYDKLKSNYGLADADFTIDKSLPRIGNYILYRRNQFRPLYQDSNGHAHWFQINNRNNDNRVVYQAFLDTATGAKFLVVSLHLPAGPNDKADDAQRKASTQSMLSQVGKLQANDPKYAHLPLIYTGDTNSFAGINNPNNYDSPGDLLAKAHASDSLMVAQSRKNTKYSSVNGYTPRPSTSGRIIDHFYGTQGAAFSSWKQIMNLKHGKWPGTIPSDHNPVTAQVQIQS